MDKPAPNSIKGCTIVRVDNGWIVSTEPTDEHAKHLAAMTMEDMTLFMNQTRLKAQQLVFPTWTE